MSPCGSGGESTLTRSLAEINETYFIASGLTVVGAVLIFAGGVGFEIDRLLGLDRVAWAAGWTAWHPTIIPCGSILIGGIIAGIAGYFGFLIRVQPRVSRKSGMALVVLSLAAVAIGGDQFLAGAVVCLLGGVVAWWGARRQLGR